MEDVNFAAQFGRVAVLMGGLSAEREVSLNSGQNVLDALLAAGVDAEIYDPKVHLQSEEGALSLKNYDRAFVVLHGPGGEDGVVQGVLEYLGVPYTGSGVRASAIGMDKALTKQIWQACQLPTPRFWLLEDEAGLERCADALDGPVMVKPCYEGSSIGMTLARNRDDLQVAYETAKQYDRKIVVEDYIDGSEYTVAILDGEPLPAIRLEVAGTFYDYEAKYQSTDTQYHLPSGLSDEDEKQLQSLCLEAYKRIGCRGWGRVDVMRSKDGQFWLLEVNTVPGMTQKSLVPKAALAAGYSFEKLVLTILASATLDSKERR